MYLLMELITPSNVGFSPAIFIWFSLKKTTYVWLYYVFL